MYLFGEGGIALIGSIIISIIGIVVLYSTGAFDMKTIGSIISGILWGAVIPIMVWGFRYKIKFRGKIAKYLRLFDPLKGDPDYIDGDRIRHYGSRDQLPSMNALLSIKELRSLEILAITHYLLILNHKDDLKEALERGVKINIHILDPTDTESVTAQAKNYGRKDIKKQIEISLSELGSITHENLSVQKYNGVIGQGIMIAHIDDSLSWIKVETYKIQNSANSRYNEACYKDHNNEFFDKYERDLKTISRPN